MASTAKSSYNHVEVEKKWQSAWQEQGLYSTSILGSKTPYYNLMMYPYPSAEGLHVGHVFAFGGADMHGRYKRMNGYDVFEPIGFDSGGIHSENFAIKMGVHPKIMTAKNIQNFTRQLKRMGNMFDWDHTVDAMDPNYYKWTQWIFTQMFKAGLAYKKASPVTWCPSCKTTVSDEQTEKIEVTGDRLEVLGGQEETGSQPNTQNLKPETSEVTVCERCKTPVEKRFMNQWFFKITEYAERLLENTNRLDWPSKILATQRNWIGKSEGAVIKFSIINYQLANKKEGNPLSSKRATPITSEGRDTKGSPLVKGGKTDQREVGGFYSPEQQVIEVFTTRPDTLHGCTYLVLAPEHPIVAALLNSNDQDPKSNKELEEYLIRTKTKTEQERKVGDKEKTGVFTGTYATNPVNGKQVPIWVADYVLMDYGEGAVMGVPAHDERDFAFATKYGLEIIPVIQPDQGTESQPGRNYIPYEGPGTLINSNDWNGWNYPQDASNVLSWLEEKSIGSKKITYKLRDWNISRQRYWGPPIPMIYCETCAKAGKSWFGTDEAKEVKEIGNWNLKIENLSEAYGWYPVPDDQLPVQLPDIDDYLPDGSGKAPLARHPEFYQTVCPGCGAPATRETDVSDTFLDSSWYFLRYPSTPGGDVDAEVARKAPFDTEITRTWLPVSQYCGGAEHSVLHLMYSRFVTMALHDMGRLGFEEPFPRFYAHGLIIKDGAKMSKSRGNVIDPDEYIDRYGIDTMRLYMAFMGPYSDGGDFRDTGIAGMQRFVKRIWNNLTAWQGFDVADPVAVSGLEQIMHQSIFKVTQGIEQFKYNTAIAALMEYMNALEGHARAYSPTTLDQSILGEHMRTFLLLLAPFAPHISEELWQIYNKTASRPESVHTQKWPAYDVAKMQSSRTTIAVQVNGKLRTTLDVSHDDAQQEAVILSLAREHTAIEKYLQDSVLKKHIFVPGKLINLVVGK